MVGNWPNHQDIIYQYVIGFLYLHEDRPSHHIFPSQMAFNRISSPCECLLFTTSNWPKDSYKGVPINSESPSYKFQAYRIVDSTSTLNITIWWGRICGYEKFQRCLIVFLLVCWNFYFFCTNESYVVYNVGIWLAGSPNPTCWAAQRWNMSTNDERSGDHGDVCRVSAWLMVLRNIRTLWVGRARV